METGVSAEHNWRRMIRIAHDFYHTWRLVAVGHLQGLKEETLELAFWETMAEITARAYRRVKGFDPQNLEAVLKAMARSSEIMGEQVRIVQEGGDWLFIHDGCPWLDSYPDHGGSTVCRPGCDHWFTITARCLNPDITVRTEAAMPDGDEHCLRRFSI